MKDEWLTAAISDDNLVADLLLRLKESSSPSSSFILKPLPPSWGLRQRRSKPSTSSSVEKKRETRRSPTTPLSWTGGGGGSPSEGCDESLSSHHVLPPPSDRFRSKILASTETPTATSSKRPRRKKTFAELKEEETSLMKERTYLKKELATLRVTLKQQRSINENLKRRKLDLKVESGIKSDANSADECNNANTGISEAASSSVSRQNKVEDASEPDSFPSQKCATSQDSLFVLPDLNMVPDEDMVVGMS